MIIYIAGPISSDTCYKAKFDAAARSIEADGDIPLNPAWQPQGLGYKQYIDNAFAMLRQADAAVFLPGWESSPGARLEHLYCETVGIAILSDDKEVSF